MRLRRPGFSSGVSTRPNAADSPPDSAPPVPGAARGEQQGEPALRRRRRRRRILIAAPFAVLLSWAVISYSAWMLGPTSESFGVRSVEWVRAEVPFGNWIVDNGEHVYYSMHAPRKGGPQLKSLPAVGLKAPRLSPWWSTAAAWPPPIKPVFPHPLPGEGVWKPAGPPVDGGPAVLVTTFRAEVDYPQLLAYVAWFDQTRTEIAYYPGRYEPPNAAVRGPMMVPNGERSRLLATFNGGFTFADGNN